jgi:hypothetical protein
MAGIRDGPIIPKTIKMSIIWTRVNQMANTIIRKRLPGSKKSISEQ